MATPKLPSFMKPSDVESMMYTEEQLKTRVAELGHEISEHYRPLLKEGDKLLVVGVLKGAFVFMSDLVRTLDVNNEHDFMRFSSYGAGVESSGNVRMMLDISKDIAGRHVLVVEDILDTGNTFKALLAMLETRKPASLRTCVLLHKYEKTMEGVVANHVGFKIPNKFVIGYGLDYDETYRSLPFIAVLDKSVYMK